MFKKINLVLMALFLTTHFNTSFAADVEQTGRAGYGSGTSDTGAGRDAPNEKVSRDVNTQKSVRTSNTNANTASKTADVSEDSVMIRSGADTNQNDLRTDVVTGDSTALNDPYVAGNMERGLSPSPLAIAFMVLIAVGLIAYVMNRRRMHH